MWKELGGDLILYGPNHVFAMVTFCAFVAPPMDENGNNFGSLLVPPLTTCDSNLGRFGHLVNYLLHFFVK